MDLYVNLPEESGRQVQYPISKKHMDQGEGTWETTKEITVYLFNGEKFTVQLMRDEFEKNLYY